MGAPSNSLRKESFFIRPFLNPNDKKPCMDQELLSVHVDWYLLLLVSPNPNEISSMDAVIISKIIAIINP
jgi:hypothetical protein